MKIRNILYLFISILIMLTACTQATEKTDTDKKNEDVLTTVTESDKVVNAENENSNESTVENESDQENDSEFIVTLIGTGEPKVQMERFSNATLVQAGDEYLLFDVGRGAVLNMSEVGVMPGMIDKLFITHLHHDHLLDYPDLLISASLLNHGEREGGLKVWGPKGTEHFVKNMHEAFQADIDNRVEIIGLPEEYFDAHVTEVEEGVVYEGDNLEVIAFQVDHGPMKPAFGYRVNYKDHSVVISGDTTYSENLIEHSQGVDLLIHEVVAVNTSPEEGYKSKVHENVEAYHTSPEQAGEVFKKVNPKLAVFSHVVTLDVTEEEANFVERAKSIYEGEIVLGQDLMSFEIGDEIKINKPSKQE